MGRVTTFILTFQLAENDAAFLKATNEWCRQHNEPLLKPTWDTEHPSFSGPSQLTTRLFFGAHDSFHLEQFMSFLRAYPWLEPDDVQFFVNGPDDSCFEERLHAFRSKRIESEKQHPDDMGAQGFIVDGSCYPWIAYKGPRFRPTELHQCYTTLESRLIRLTARMRAA